MSTKILEFEQLSDRCEKLRSAGKKIVATTDVLISCTLVTCAICRRRERSAIFWL